MFLKGSECEPLPSIVTLSSRRSPKGGLTHTEQWPYTHTNKHTHTHKHTNTHTKTHTQHNTLHTHTRHTHTHLISWQTCRLCTHIYLCPFTDTYFQYSTRVGLHSWRLNV